MIKNKICESCGEEKATQKIFNPNWDEQEKKLFWDVCVTCSKIIDQQMKQSFGMILKEHEKKHNFNTDISKKMIDESNKEIQRLSYESGKEVLSAEITL